MQKAYVLREVEFSDEQRDILIGAMLGDGSLKRHLHYNASFYFSQSLNKRGYVEWMQEKFTPFSMPTTIVTKPKTVRYSDGRIGKSESDVSVSAKLTTVSHPYLTQLEEIWYKRTPIGEYQRNANGWRIKTIPLDLILSPQRIAVWFWDDGSNNGCNSSQASAKTGIYYRQAVLNTQAFTWDECDRLRFLLYQCGIVKTVIRTNRGKPVICIRGPSYYDLLDMVRPFLPHLCLEYKVIAAPKGRSTRDRMSESLIARIKGLLPFLSRSDVAKQCGVPYHAVSNVDRGLSGRDISATVVDLSSCHNAEHEKVGLTSAEKAARLSPVDSCGRNPT